MYRLRLRYNGREDYKKWADKLWQSGYNLPVTLVCKRIGVSMSWIKNVLLNEIKSIVYDRKYMYAYHNEYNTLTFINENEFMEWIYENATFLVQTEMVDLYSYISIYPSIANKVLHMYHDFKKKQGIEGFDYSIGMLPEPIIDYLNGEIFFADNLRNVRYYRRNEVIWQEIQPFNIFNKGAIFPSDDVTLETFYRRAFIKGLVKVKMGNQIAIFYENSNNHYKDCYKMKIPFLIKYNSSIRVLSKR